MASYMDLRKPVRVMGFAKGDIAYVTQGRDQYQVRLSSIVGSSAEAICTMRRHRETVNGVDQGVWCKWTPIATLRMPVHLKDCRKIADQ